MNRRNFFMALGALLPFAQGVSMPIESKDCWLSWRMDRDEAAALRMGEVATVMLKNTPYLVSVSKVESCGELAVVTGRVE